jgi:hypothetical protein
MVGANWAENTIVQLVDKAQQKPCGRRLPRRSGEAGVGTGNGWEDTCCEIFDLRFGCC